MVPAMTTFEAILHSILHSFSEFVPVASGAHRAFLTYATEWPAPSTLFQGAIGFGAFLAVFLYFWNDWASIISSFLQVLIYRKKPMTMDERMPFFLTLSSLPPLIAWTYLREDLQPTVAAPLVFAFTMGFFGLPLWFADPFSRRNKNMSAWNWKDALGIGLAQIFFLVPGCGIQGCSLPLALLRNYTREAALKYTFLAMTPVLLFVSLFQLRGLSFKNPMPSPEISWLSLGTATVVTLVSGLLVIGWCNRHIQTKGVGKIVAWRWLIAFGFIGIYWLRNKIS